MPAHREPQCFLTDDEWQTINFELQLTNRELDIVMGVLHGLSEPAIAVRLGISTNTVHTHLGRVYKKLRVRSVAGLILRVFARYLESTRKNITGSTRSPSKG